LVPVTDQCDPGAVFVGDGQQCAGGVLVKHAGLVNEQHVPRGDHGIVARAGEDNAGVRVGVTDAKPGPRAVLVPAEAVLVGQPCRRRGVAADLPGRHSGRLQRRCHHP
jgi:hypothetical protein